VKRAENLQIIVKDGILNPKSEEALNEQLIV
jgi:hypothetical protein